MEVYLLICGYLVGDGKLYTLHFADNQVIMAEDEDGICCYILKLMKSIRNKI